VAVEREQLVVRALLDDTALVSTTSPSHASDGRTRSAGRKAWLGADRLDSLHLGHNQSF